MRRISALFGITLIRYGFGFAELTRRRQWRSYTVVGVAGVLQVSAEVCGCGCTLCCSTDLDFVRPDVSC